jgi:hypothetical protein
MIDGGLVCEWLVEDIWMGGWLVEDGWLVKDG